MKFYKYIVISFVSISGILNNSCQNNTSVKTNDPTFAKDSIVEAHDSVTPVIILASSDDPKSLENISLIYHSGFMNSHQDYPDRDALDESMQLTMDYIPHPGIIRLSTFRDSVSYQATRILVTPGDSVALCIKIRK